MTPQDIQERVEDTQQWAACLQEVHARIGARFARAEQRQRVLRYLQGC